MSGRDFTSGDRMGAPPVILVNRSFARRQFGQESPLNKRIKFANSQSSGEWFTVVGVIPDLYLEERFSLTHPAAAYIPLAQAELLGGDQALQSITLVARTELQPTQITAEVRETVAQLNPNIPLYDVQSYGTALQQALVGVMVIGSIFTIFGVVALFLAAVGLYGVISFSARQRTRELGIRIAFGARARDTFGLVLKDGAKQLALGLAAGLLLGQGLARAIQVVLFDVNPRDPVLLATVAVILSLTALAATVIPARRASRIDPMLAIRSE